MSYLFLNRLFMKVDFHSLLFYEPRQASSRQRAVERLLVWTRIRIQCVGNFKNAVREHGT